MASHQITQKLNRHQTKIDIWFYHAQFHFFYSIQLPDATSATIDSIEHHTKTQKYGLCEECRNVCL